MAAITLSEEQREIVRREAGHFAERISGEAKETYARLAAEAGGGEVSEALVPALGELLSWGLSSGRIRTVHGPHGEMEAVGLYRRTPQGKAFHAQFDDVNAMFSALEGQTIHKVSLSARGPGLFTLTVETDASRIVASLTKEGVDVRSVEIAM